VGGTHGATMIGVSEIVRDLRKRATKRFWASSSGTTPAHKLLTDTAGCRHRSVVQPTTKTQLTRHASTSDGRSGTRPERDLRPLSQARQAAWYSPQRCPAAVAGRRAARQFLARTEPKAFPTAFDALLRPAGEALLFQDIPLQLVAVRALLQLSHTHRLTRARHV
jgi:hypothetical protein